MNKKIKQFSEQAIHDDNGETLHFLPNPRYIEKFSNLIIQEHLSVWEMMDNGNKVAGYVEMEDYPKAILKHFGTENFDPTDDGYEKKFTCLDCGKIWREDV